MSYSKIETDVIGISEDIVKSRGYEIYDVLYVKEGPHRFLRIFIDSDNGVNLDDCEFISRAVGEILDKRDFIPDNYFLEVSSPGIERALRQDKHFTDAIGENVKLKLYSPIEKNKEIEGQLVSFKNDLIGIMYNEKELEIDRKNVAKANIVFSF